LENDTILKVDFNSRYECEGRSAGALQGALSSSENKTYPTIEIVGYQGPAVVVASCVDEKHPYKTHPHNLVGKMCKKGVCSMDINPVDMTCVFQNLGVQCVKKKDASDSLTQRQAIR
jgi:c-Rel proto-oncogene protein